MDFCIKLFDYTGKHIQSFGNKGKDKGDILDPVRMFVDSNKEILILDRKKKKLIFFSFSGKFLRDNLGTFLPLTSNSIQLHMIKAYPFRASDSG